MSLKLKLIAVIICVSLCTIGFYYWAYNQRGGTIRSFYLTEPSIANGTITVTVWNSTNPSINDIYVGFNKNDGGGAIHPDSYTRCIGNLTNNTSTDWIAFSDNDFDELISINDTFMISQQVFQNQTIQHDYLDSGWYSIMFSDEGKVRYLAIILIDSSEV